MSIDNISLISGGNLLGGEKLVRFKLNGFGLKPTGREVFEITALNSSTILDIKGNNFIIENSKFQLKPPVSGNISTEKSILTVTPKEMIPDGEKRSN